MLRRWLQRFVLTPPGGPHDSFISLPTRRVSARYEFCVDDRSIPALDLVGNPAFLLDYYLHIDDLSCCSVLGGFVIDADGQVAMGVTDEVSMSQSWLPAIIRLQRGERSVDVRPWEESHLTLTRNGDLVQMEDVLDSGTVVCAKVQFLLEDFVRAMLDASRPMASLVSGLHSEIERRLANSSSLPDHETIEKLQFLRDEISPDWSVWIKESESLLRT